MTRCWVLRRVVCSVLAVVALVARVWFSVVATGWSRGRVVGALRRAVLLLPLLPLSLGFCLASLMSGFTLEFLWSSAFLLIKFKNAPPGPAHQP